MEDARKHNCLDFVKIKLYKTAGQKRYNGLVKKRLHLQVENTLFPNKVTIHALKTYYINVIKKCTIEMYKEY